MSGRCVETHSHPSPRSSLMKRGPSDRSKDESVACLVDVERILKSQVIGMDLKQPLAQHSEGLASFALTSRSGQATRRSKFALNRNVGVPLPRAQMFHLPGEFSRFLRISRGPLLYKTSTIIWRRSSPCIYFNTASNL